MLNDHMIMYLFTAGVKTDCIVLESSLLPSIIGADSVSSNSLI